jgi:hypothetical protein
MLHPSSIAVASRSCASKATHEVGEVVPEALAVEVGQQGQQLVPQLAPRAPRGRRVLQGIVRDGIVSIIL